MEKSDMNLESNEVNENNPASENKKKNYFQMIMIGVLILIPVVFLIIFFAGKDKPAADQQSVTTQTTQTSQTTQTQVTPEQHLVNALKVAKTDTSEAALADLGLAYIDNEMYKESIETLKKVIVINPKNSLALNNLGFAYGCIKDWNNGIKYCQMALKLDPSFQLAKNNLNWMQDEKQKAGN